MTGLSTRWPSQWLHFLNFLSPKWLCYKASLTHPKCTKSHLQQSRLQKIFLRRKSRTPAFEGAASRRGRGWEGRRRDGRGKGRWCGGAQKVVCSGARAGSRRAWPSGILRRLSDGLECAAWRPPRPVAQCRQFQEDAKDASVSECTWTLSALEALRNALYKFKTYLLIYL